MTTKCENWRQDARLLHPRSTYMKKKAIWETFERKSNLKLDFWTPWTFWLTHLICLSISSSGLQVHCFNLTLLPTRCTELESGWHSLTCYSNIWSTGSSDWLLLIMCAVSVFPVSGSLSTSLLLSVVALQYFLQPGQDDTEPSELLVTFNWPCVPGAVTHWLHSLVIMFWCPCLTLFRFDEFSSFFSCLRLLQSCHQQCECVNVLIIYLQLSTIIRWQKVKGEDCYVTVIKSHQCRN